MWNMITREGQGKSTSEYSAGIAGIYSCCDNHSAMSGRENCQNK